MATQSVANPEEIERFINELSAIYDKSQAGAQAAGQDRNSEPGLDVAEAERHFEQAANAFNRLWRQGDFRSPGGREDGDFVLLDRDGRIVSVQGSSGPELPFVDGASVFAAEMDAGGEQMLKAGIKQIVSTVPGVVSCIVAVYQANRQRSLWALSPVGANGVGAIGRLNRIDFDWSEAAGEAITEAFALSNSEREVLKTLVKGQTLTDLADQRGRSVETVRTQAKSLLAKTGVSSQLDLVRLFAAISLVTPALDTQICVEPEEPVPAGSFSLTLPDLRQLQVETYGPPGGRPMVFLHNMFSGSVMPPVVVEALNRHDVRLICPWRPGFAKSTARLHFAGPPEKAFAADLAYLLDLLGIGQTVVIGHMSAAVYAAAAAAELPERFTRAVAIAGFPPFLSRRNIDRLPAWPRLFAYTSRYFPKALSLLVRGTFGLLVENRIEVLFNNLFAGAAVDTEVISAPDVRSLFLNDFRRAFEQGTAAYEVDAALAASDWTPWLERIAPQRMTFIHGVEDPVTPIDLVAEIAAKRPEIDLVPIPDAGQMVLYRVPEQILSLLSSLDA